MGDLKKAGVTTWSLRHAGYSARALKAAGYSAMSLLEAGYTYQHVQRAGYSRDQLGQTVAFAEERGHCSELSSYFEDIDLDDPDLDDPLEWSLLDIWLAKESKAASRSKTTCKTVHKDKLAALKQRQKFRSKEERPCPQRKLHVGRSRWGVQRDIDSVWQDPCDDLLGKCNHESLPHSPRLSKHAEFDDVERHLGNLCLLIENI